MGEGVRGGGAMEMEVGGAWRRSSFCMASFWSSRFRRSLSEERVVDCVSSWLSLVSRSLTCFSLRSRKAR